MNDSHLTISGLAPLGALYLTVSSKEALQRYTSRHHSLGRAYPCGWRYSGACQERVVIQLIELIELAYIHPFI